MEQFLTIREHKEYALRMEIEHKHINEQLTKLEDNAKQISDLVLAMHDMTTSLKTLNDKLTKVDDQLSELKEVPAKRWDKLVGGIIGAVAGAIGCALVASLANYL